MYYLFILIILISCFEDKRYNDAFKKCDCETLIELDRELRIKNIVESNKIKDEKIEDLRKEIKELKTYILDNKLEEY